MYWVLWMILGLITVEIYSAFVLPKVLRSAQPIFGAGKHKVLYVIKLSALMSIAVFMLVFVITTFVCQCIGGLKVGSLKAAPFAVWTLYVFLGVALVLFLIGMIVCKKEDKDKKLELGFILPKFKVNKDRTQLAINVLFAVALCIASLMMALFLDYIIIRLFKAALGKRLLLLMLVAEIAIIAAIEYKKLRKIKEILPKTVILLFVLWAALYVVLTVASSETIEWIFLVGGAMVFAAIAMFWTWSLIERKTRANSPEKIIY